MSIDAIKSANVPVPIQNTSNGASPSEDSKTAYELGKEAYKVKADQASIALAQSEITYYEDLLKKDNETLKEMIEKGTSDAKELAVIGQRVFDTDARVKALKANVAEAEAEMDRNAGRAGGGATQKASDASAPSESAKTPAGENDFRSRLKTVLASIPPGGFGTPAGKTVFEFAKELDPVEPNPSSIDFAKLTNTQNREALQKAEALLGEMLQAGGVVQSEFVKLSGWVFELGAFIKGREASLEEAEFKFSGTAAGAENTPPVVKVSTARPAEDTEDIKFLRHKVTQHKLEVENAYAELQARNQEYSTAQDRSGNIQSLAVEAADYASNRAEYKYNQTKATLANFEAELARAIAANVSGL